MTSSVEVDEAACIGAGHCVVAAPEVFDQREEDGVVMLLDERPPAGQSGNVREAARMCPATAIQVRPESSRSAR